MDFNNISFEMPKNRSAAIKVIGVGGGGSNAVNYMFEQGITGVDFIVSNTDAQALEKSPVPTKVQLGVSITEGLGAGANPEVGEQAALETLDDIKSILDNNTKMVFITAGMGGGTGTGAAPIIAKCAKEMGILTVGICTAPFSFEGKKRVDQAKEGIEKLRSSVDSLIIINNDKLRELYGNLGYKTGFAKADEVLATAAKGIAEVITHEYSINIDLRDARTVLADSGTAIMGSARASGESKAKKAIEAALDSPLLNDNKITGAKNVLLLIVSGDDEVTMDEIGIINDYIQAEAGNNANIIMGMGEEDGLGEDISVTIVATGFPIEQQDYNGQEDKTIVYNLGDLEEHNQNISVSKIQVEEKLSNVDIKMNEDESSNNDINNDLDDSLTIKSETKSIEDSTEDSTEDSENNIFNFEIFDKNQKPTEDKTASNDNHQEPISDKQSNSEKEKGYTLFELDDEWEEEIKAPSISGHAKIIQTEKTPQQQNETTAFGSLKQDPSKVEPKSKINTSNEVKVKTKKEIKTRSFNDELSQQINDRRERLKKFNFKFKTSLEEKEEMSNVPAYKRQGVQLSEHQHQRPSNYIIDEDKNNNIKIRPNNFLHDNVD